MKDDKRYNNKAMATASQIEKIEGLNNEALDSLLVKILSKKEFESIQQLEDCIKAKQKTFLNTSAAVFITFPYKLGGTSVLNYDDIGKKIKEIGEKYAANNVFVYSKLTITKGFQQTINGKLHTIRLTYIGRDELIALVDECFPEYWRHDDISLIQYEKAYMDFVANDSDLKKLKFPNDKYAKLLTIFIEPMLLRYYQDSKTHTAMQKKCSV